MAKKRSRGQPTSTPMHSNDNEGIQKGGDTDAASYHFNSEFCS